MERYAFSSKGKSIYLYRRVCAIVAVGRDDRKQTPPSPRHCRLPWCSWWAPSSTYFLTSMELSHIVQKESIVETFPSQSGTFLQKVSEMEYLTKGRKLTGMRIQLHPGWPHSYCCKIHPLQSPNKGPPKQSQGVPNTTMVPARESQRKRGQRLLATREESNLQCFQPQEAAVPPTLGGNFLLKWWGSF